MTRTCFYAWPDTDAAAADGAMINDPETGACVAAPGWTIRSLNGEWITQPVYGEPDPETGEQVVIEPGVRSDPVVLVRSQPCPACSAQAFTAAAGGLA